MGGSERKEGERQRRGRWPFLSIYPYLLSLLLKTFALAWSLALEVQVTCSPPEDLPQTYCISSRDLAQVGVPREAL